LNLKEELESTQKIHISPEAKAVFTLRTTSDDIVRQGIQRCRTMSCAVWTPLKPYLRTIHRTTPYGRPWVRIICIMHRPLLPFI